MTGICGIVGLEDISLIKKMSDIIFYRGDNEIIGIYKNACFAERNFYDNRELIQNEDGNIVMVADADIYNYDKLKENLEKRGHSFSTDLNEEVIVHAYEEYGERCCEFLDGDFVFAIWDSNKSKLMLARDKFGVRPLYYTLDDTRILFGSEIKSLLTVSEKKEINFKSTSDYLILGNFLGSLTFFKNIYVLLPAHILTYKFGRTKVSRYWVPKFRIAKNTEEYCSKMLYNFLKESVRKRIGEVNGLYLGGFDSSVICSLMAEFSDEPIRTFTTCYRGDKLDTEIDVHNARIVSDYFGTKHTEVAIEPNDVAKMFYKIIWRNEYKSCVDGAHMYRLAEKASFLKGNKIFTGMCADVLTISMSKNESTLLKFRKLPFWLTKTAEIFSREFVPKLGRTKSIKMREYLDGISCMTTPQGYLIGKKIAVNYLYKDVISRFDETKNDINKEIIYPALKLYPKSHSSQLFLMYLTHAAPGKWISYMENVSITQSMLIGFPYLDENYIAFARSIPPPLLRSKYIQRRAFSNKLPPEIINRKKDDRTSIARIFNGEFGEVALQILNNYSIIQRDTEHYLNKHQILKYTQKFKEHSFKWGYQDKKFLDMIQMLVSIEGWNKTFIERDDIRRPLK
ncbi:MAG: hypothetical protein KKA79_02315 [Nanoarchaeota archaeon]|nr:hypothetical protein [Nanoarchaeota archaeon]MCG2718060.1 asparagine synthase-related protein [Nanoarchaeota archaeon]